MKRVQGSRTQNNDQSKDQLKFEHKQYLWKTLQQLTLVEKVFKKLHPNIKY